MNEFVTVYSAEVVRRLRSRMFLVGMLLGAIGIAALLKLPVYMQGFANQANRVVLAGDPELIARARPLLAKDYPIAGAMPGRTAIAPTDLSRRKNVGAILVLQRSGGRLSVVAYATDPANVSANGIRRDLEPLSLAIATGLSQSGVDAAIGIPVRIDAVNSKFGNVAQAEDARVIAYLLLFLLYLLIMVNSQLIMSSVAEEKTSRIAELLVSSVKPSSLLAGKIAASATLAIVQMAVWIAVGFALGAHPGAASSVDASSAARGSTFSLSNVSPGDMADFGIFFLLGYLQMSTMFAAVGSLVNRTEDLGGLAGPLVIPVVAAFIIAISALEAPHAPVVIATSFIPLIAPFVMFARIVVSEVPAWQVGLSLAINVAATYAIALLGGKIYRVGMLLYGRPPKFSQVWQVLRS